MKKIVNIPVIGMHCASCAIHIQRALRKTGGVTQADVNYATEKARIEFEEEKVDVKSLSKVVDKLGYKLANGDSDNNQEKHSRELKYKSIVSGAIAVVLLWASLPGVSQSAPEILKNVWLQLILASIVQFGIGKDFYRSTWSALRNRAANMDTLITIGTTVAYAYSVLVAAWPEVVEGVGVEAMPYFDTSTTIIALILLGKWLEANARGKTSEAIKKLMGLRPKTARVLRGEVEVDVALDEVIIGDKLRLRPGEKVPVDGKVLNGETSIDESMVTGESIPVYKHEGDQVIGGTLNSSGSILMIAEKVGSETMLAQIIKLVEEAQATRAPVQKIADKISGYFVPVVLMLSVATFAGWYIFGPQPAAIFAMLNSIAVLIIACPCALGLATPTALVVGTGLAAGRGILIKDAETLEVAHDINHVIFDKTGTLTEGKPKVTDVVSFASGVETNEILRISATLESRSEHPLGRAIIESAGTAGLKLFDIDNFVSLAGRGVKGRINKEEYTLGSPQLLGEADQQIEALEDQGKTVVILVKNGKGLGIIAIADTVRSTAQEAVTMLKKSGIETSIITGDNPRTAKSVAGIIGIERYFAQVLPADKERIVRELQKEGKIVAMVGDGVNDAPALSAANVGIAMASGTDVAMESAGMTLVNRDLKIIPLAIRISKLTLRTIKTNLFWAFAYNVILIPVAALGILSPIMASLAMATSSISVVGNSLLLKKIKL